MTSIAFPIDDACDLCRSEHAVMWVRIDDRFVDHPKIVALSDPAFRAYVWGLCYCGAYLTDGVIPRNVVRDARPVVRELVKAGLWAERVDAFVVHDWADYNPPAEAIRQRRKAERERKRRQRRGDGGAYS